jgi:hypothetical protein
MYYRVNGAIVENYCEPNTLMLFNAGLIKPSKEKISTVPNPWLYSPGFSKVGVF